MIREQYLIKQTPSGPMIGGKIALWPNKNEKIHWPQTVREVIKRVSGEEPMFLTHKNRKEVFQFMTKEIGITPKKYYKYYCANVIGGWYGDIGTEKRQIANKICLTRNGMNCAYKKVFFEMYDEIKWCFDNNLGHMTPFILIEEKSFNEIKEIMNSSESSPSKLFYMKGGQNEWNALLNNSLSRNHDIASILEQNNIHLHLKYLVSLPSTWLHCPQLLWRFSHSVVPKDWDNISQIARKYKFVSNKKVSLNLFGIIKLLKENLSINDNDIFPFTDWMMSSIKEGKKDYISITNKSFDEAYKIYKRKIKLESIK